jgi:hypothetical protein
MADAPSVADHMAFSDVAAFPADAVPAAAPASATPAVAVPDSDVLYICQNKEMTNNGRSTIAKADLNC